MPILEWAGTPVQADHRRGHTTASRSRLAGSEIGNEVGIDIEDPTRPKLWLWICVWVFQDGTK
jgi:hypothetical protein